VIDAYFLVLTYINFLADYALVFVSMNI